VASKLQNRQLIRGLFAFMTMLVIAWGVFYAAWAGFPHIRPGATQIYDMKGRVIANESVFPSSADVRVLVVGNSRILSGFIPSRFDAVAGGRLVSYNFGLPGSSRFMDELQTLINRGSSPTHVVMTIPWSANGEPTGLQLLKNDKKMIRVLFPFRDVIRDALQFVVRSRAHGGLNSFYQYNVELVERARQDRGYFFIEHSSHYPNHRLPPDFRTGSETPNQPWRRTFSLDGPIFDKLQQLSHDYGIRFIVAPDYIREGQYATAASNDSLRLELAQFDIQVVGPSYWLYPNSNFSDPGHLNRDGAEQHTDRLWELLGPVILPNGTMTSKSAPGTP